MADNPKSSSVSRRINRYIRQLLLHINEYLSIYPHLEGPRLRGLEALRLGLLEALIGEESTSGADIQVDERLDVVADIRRVVAVLRDPEVNIESNLRQALDAFEALNEGVVECEETQTHGVGGQAIVAEELLGAVGGVGGEGNGDSNASPRGPTPLSQRSLPSNTTDLPYVDSNSPHSQSPDTQSPDTQSPEGSFRSDSNTS